MLLTKKQINEVEERTVWFWFVGFLFCFFFGSQILHFEIVKDVQDSTNAGIYK